MKEIFMENQIQISPISSVERNKVASRLCQKLFPEFTKPPTQGELQRIISEARVLDASEEEIFQAGQWWLWARNLAIENTFSKQTQISMMRVGIKAAMGSRPVNFVSCRSPELLHAQAPAQGDLVLPRSRKAIAKLKELITTSQRFLPTSLFIVFADLAIDNLTEIEKKCNVEETIKENLKRLTEIIRQEGINPNLLRMSMLKLPDRRNLGEVIQPDGTLKVAVTLNRKAEELIKTATRESLLSHQRMFSWTEEQSLAHNRNLGVTMGFVGKAIQNSIPSAVLIHNEAFISRGPLNNLFTDPQNPLIVICLRDLLETKGREISNSK